MFSDILVWIGQNGTRSLGLLFGLVSLFLALSELRVYLKHRSSAEQLVLWASAAVAGIIVFIFDDTLLGALSGITLLMLYETYELRDAPVWGKLMVASLISYMTILGGKIAQMIFNYVTKSSGEDVRIFSTTFIFSIYVFFIVSFIFFGKQFILVSRLSSPQMVYLFLFAILYAAVASVKLGTVNYLGLKDTAIAERILFGTFGIYELLIIVMTLMYFISGYLLDFLFGVKEVKDPEVLRKVKEVADRMGIKEELKVGFVEAPILNAFAYGPFNDKRISFIAADINQFTDSDIRGVVGHELAHATKNHTFYLLLISVLEIFVKKLFKLPATYFDYTIAKSGLGISFLQYFLLNYALIILLYILVRALEGHADKLTKEAGYGDDLSRALFRLEGFYQGVASDFGISVNLLTNKQYTEAEREKFTAAAGKNIYQEFLNPTRSAAFSNIFVSHPRTSYRITALVRDDISPIKSAFLPYNILGLWKRSAAIKKLNESRTMAKKLLDETFKEDFHEDAIRRVTEFTPVLEPYQHLVGKEVIAFESLTKDVVIGVVDEAVVRDEVTSPVYLRIGDKEISTTEYSIKEYVEGDYVLKMGERFTLNEHRLDEEKGLLIIGEMDGETTTIPFAELGVPVKFFHDSIGKHTFYYDQGSAVLAELKEFREEEELRESVFVFGLPDEDKELKMSEIVIGFMPIGVQFRREKTEAQMELLRSTVGEKVSMYTKENYDVPVSGRVVEVTDEKIELEDADGRHSYKMSALEFIMLYRDTFEVFEKDKLSFFDKMALWWANRNKFVNIR